MMRNEEVRIDKWLWAVRIFKTRSLAAEACKKNRVQLNGVAAKASRTIKENDVIEVRKVPVLYRYKVIALLEKRVGAKLVENYMQDMTPEQEIVKLDLMRLDSSGGRSKGRGRPTKRERRMLDVWNTGEDE